MVSKVLNEMIAERRKAQKGFLPSLVGFFERGWFAPFLLSIQPVLYLFSINVAELYFSEILRSLLVSLLLGTLLFGVVYFLLRNGRRASLVASLFLFLFFLFGDVAVWTSETFRLGPARANFMTLAFVTIVMVIWIWLVQKRIRDVASVNLYFNLLAVLFFVNSGIRVGSYLLENDLSLTPNRSVQAAVVQSAEPRPDIYYIILDGYGRQDILQALYEFDNSSFLNELSARGFYVAEESTSNYIQTMLSLSSSFNMDYLQSLKAQGTKIENRADLVKLVENNKIRSLLAQNGYQLISFHNEYKATIPSAEIYYSDSQTGLVYPVTAFESILIDRSMARVLSHVPALNKALIEMPYDTHRRHILFTFDKLQEVPALDGNYFVYAHIIAPHPPFVFDEHGSVVTHNEPFTLHDANYYIRDHSQKNYIAGYRRQIQYINTLVLETVDAILRRSTTPPIIIIQGDHGPGAYLHWGSLENTIPAERFGILSAYYFPGGDYSLLYPSISPINSFRVLFNQFFGADYEMLPDRHYYSSWSFPFDFVEVTNLPLP
jgi:hypothetical protein